MLESWIDEANVFPWVELVAGYAQYNIAAWDYDAITHGLSATSGERGQYFAYELGGDFTVSLELASDLGSCVIRVRVESPESILRRVEVATDICAEFVLKRE